MVGLIPLLPNQVSFPYGPITQFKKNSNITSFNLLPTTKFRMKEGYQNSQFALAQEKNYFQPEYNRTSQRLPYQSQTNTPVEPIQQNSRRVATITRRDGWGSQGYGPGHGVGSAGHSPAISALALLGFLFFLNMIQNSLQNNRLLLSSYNPLATNASFLVSGRSSSSRIPSLLLGQNGRVRQRRGFGYDSHISAPESIPTQPIRSFRSGNGSNSSNVLNNKRLNFHTRVMLEDPPYINNINDKIQQPTEYFEGAPITSDRNQSQNPLNITSKLLKRLKWLSLTCLQLMACNVGRSLFSEVGPKAQFLMSTLGSNILPRASQKSWKGRMMRALTFGWKYKNECNRVFKCNFHSFDLANR